MELTERVSPGVAWLGTFAGAIVAFAVGVLAFPRLVWDRFLWQYFWGPVYADALNARCAVMTDAGPRLLGDASACRNAIASGRIVAEPGYTLVSEAGYAITLLFFLVGVLYLLRYLEVGTDRGFYFALVPFMLFGGALRVVEDAINATPPGVTPVVSYPLNTLIISPIIYFTVFVVTVAALVGSIWLVRRGTVDDYERALATAGGVVFVLTAGYLFGLSFTKEYVGFYPQVTVLTLGIATALAWGVFRALERYAPEVNAGTGRMGLVVLWAHAIDGVANVIASDWATKLGLAFNYGSKHPVDRIIVGITERVLPPSVVAVTGDSWGFLLVKILAAVAVLAIFDRDLFEESPRYAILLLVAITAVGLGPGTRDMLRVTFGI
ncbi:MAG: DUF63 family protein [Haloarculaceae archaeon]